MKRAVKQQRSHLKIARTCDESDGLQKRYNLTVVQMHAERNNRMEGRGGGGVQGVIKQSKCDTFTLYKERHDRTHQVNSPQSLVAVFDDGALGGTHEIGSKAGVVVRGDEGGC